MDMKTYAEEMRELLVPMLQGSHAREEVARPTRIALSRVTAKQRRQVDALSKERGYRPFQAWHLST
jgi:hypothetical protein